MRAVLLAAKSAEALGELAREVAAELPEGWVRRGTGPYRAAVVGDDVHEQLREFVPGRPRFTRPKLAFVYSGQGGLTGPQPQRRLLALQMELTAALEAHGYVPDAVLGHSLGEVAAWWRAGSLDGAAATAFVSFRGERMRALPVSGLMVTLFCSEAEAQRGLIPGVEVAAVLSPHHTVIGGPAAQVRAVAAEIPHRELAIEQASHCALVDPILDELAAYWEELRPAPPQLPVVSDLTGELRAAAPDGAYIRAQTRQTAQLHRAAATLGRMGVGVYVEIGPEPSLTRLGLGGEWIAVADPHQPPELALAHAVASLHRSGM